MNTGSIATSQVIENLRAMNGPSSEKRLPTSF
jgi:hypothetical protein